MHSYVIPKEEHIINFCKHCKMHRYHRSLSLNHNDWHYILKDQCPSYFGLDI